VEVEDTVTVTHNDAVGLYFSHQLILKDKLVRDVLLGGQSVNEGICGVANEGNPSVFVQTNRTHVGAYVYAEAMELPIMSCLSIL
jgi:hypothetical protein